jgi:ABC-type sugar transport system substrate-binding protein
MTNCHNDEMALGALRSIIAANRLDGIKVFGIDAIADAKNAVKNDQMAATVRQQPYLHMAKAVMSADRILKGEKVDKLILIPLQLVNKENLE